MCFCFWRFWLSIVFRVSKGSFLGFWFIFLGSDGVLDDGPSSESRFVWTQTTETHQSLGSYEPKRRRWRTDGGCSLEDERERDKERVVGHEMSKKNKKGYLYPTKMTPFWGLKPLRVVVFWNGLPDPRLWPNPSMCLACAPDPDQLWPLLTRCLTRVETSLTHVWIAVEQCWLFSHF